RHGLIHTLATDPAGQPQQGRTQHRCEIRHRLTDRCSHASLAYLTKRGTASVITRVVPRMVTAADARTLGCMPELVRPPAVRMNARRTALVGTALWFVTFVVLLCFWGW